MLEMLFLPALANWSVGMSISTSEELKFSSSAIILELIVMPLRNVKIRQLVRGENEQEQNVGREDNDRLTSIQMGRRIGDQAGGSREADEG